MFAHNANDRSWKSTAEGPCFVCPRALFCLTRGRIADTLTGVWCIAMNVSLLKKAAREIAKRHDLELVVLFGSAARGKTHKFSDVDIAIKPKKQVSYRDEAVMEMEFQRALKLGNVEIVNMREVKSPLLQYAIASDGIVLFQESREIFDEFQIFATHLYREARPLFDLEKRYVAKHIAHYAE